MARQVTCKICGSKILQSEAYCVISETKTGSKKRNYYCDSIEYDSFIYEKETIKQQKEEIFNTINEILGYECINFNLITKELSPIVKIYTYEEILEFEKLMVNKEEENNMPEYKDKNGNIIKAGMKLKHDDGDIDTVLSSGDNLGFNATNIKFEENHPDNDIPLLIYPLSEFRLTEWEIIS
jgi:hypothetical protein